MAFTTASASAYELSIGRWSRTLAGALVEWVSPRGEDMLDVGCGTGHLAHALADACPMAAITGVDILPGLLESARRKDHPRCHFAVGDAMALPFPDSVFDFVISQLVLNFLPDPGLAIAQMARVARPGATVSGAVWDIENGLPAFHFLWKHACEVAPELLCHYSRWREQPATRIQVLSHHWREAGLHELRTARLDMTMRFETFDDFWLPASHGGQAFGRALGTLDSDMQATVARHMAEAYDQASDCGVAMFPASVIAIAGIR